MPRDGSQNKEIPILLEDAIEASGLTRAAVARAWATKSGTKPESKRRLLQKYLKGESVPDKEGARELASVLGQPADHFVTERQRVARRDLDAVWLEIAHIHEALADLSRALGDR